MDLMVWLGIMIITILIEVITIRYFTIWFSIGALAAVAATLLNAPVAVQIVVFVVVSVLALIFLRPILVKWFNRDKKRARVEGMIGRQAIVISDIDNTQGGGLVRIGKKEWSARRKNDRARYRTGDVIRVTAVTGNYLIVEE